MSEATYVLLHEADEVVEKLCKKYPEQLCDVDQSQVSIIAIEGKEKPEKCNYLARIRGLKPPVSLLTNGKIYIIELYMTDWEKWNVAQRNIVLFHELLHINGEGKNKKHDLQDFKMLINKLGVDYINSPELPDILQKDVDWTVNG